ncbi:MAG: hypothetical protein G01um10148_238 [Parcubacteria group bacterium Gr01-1014_8]|nr:MAG: hypothetical protein G01um10148_238 [Parcubacteria group bacterium Gr01-1014_8]
MRASEMKINFQFRASAGNNFTYQFLFWFCVQFFIFSCQSSSLLSLLTGGSKKPPRSVVQDSIVDLRPLSSDDFKASFALCTFYEKLHFFKVL